MVIKTSSELYNFFAQAFDLFHKIVFKGTGLRNREKICSKPLTKIHTKTENASSTELKIVKVFMPKTQRAKNSSSSSKNTLQSDRKEEEMTYIK